MKHSNGLKTLFNRLKLNKTHILHKILFHKLNFFDLSLILKQIPYHRRLINMGSQIRNMKSITWRINLKGNIISETILISSRIELMVRGVRVLLKGGEFFEGVGRA